jgi:chromate reductase, NAD(P)H dehydrogenase (quinone)
METTRVTRTVTLLAMSGSLRGASTNTQLLRAAEKLAPENMRIEQYEDLGNLPHFNPDFAESPPAIVVELCRRIGKADGLLISCPEYARGIPGSFKNALDWLVSSSEFPDKPVALFNTSARASAAQAALRLVLQTMSARLIDEASITVELLSRKLDTQAIASSDDIAPVIVDALSKFAAAIRPSEALDRRAAEDPEPL